VSLSSHLPRSTCRKCAPEPYYNQPCAGRGTCRQPFFVYPRIRGEHPVCRLEMKYPRHKSCFYLRHATCAFELRKALLSRLHNTQRKNVFQSRRSRARNRSFLPQGRSHKSSGRDDRHALHNRTIAICFHTAGGAGCTPQDHVTEIRETIVTRFCSKKASCAKSMPFAL
jgi:hypothetical protein